MYDVVPRQNVSHTGLNTAPIPGEWGEHRAGTTRCRGDRSDRRAGRATVWPEEAGMPIETEAARAATSEFPGAERRMPTGRRPVEEGTA